MRVQPRQQLLDTWRALVRTSLVDNAWVWGGVGGRDSLSDGAQLLCLMAPATKIEAFKLDQPDETAEDILAALSGLGDSVELPRQLLRLINEYLQTYVDPDGTPVFSGATYVHSVDPDTPATDEQLRLDLANSYSVSVQLSLAVIGFLRVFRTVLRREDLIREATQAEALASTRLTGALVGLLRSFAINVFDATSPEGLALCRTVNQANLPQRRVVDELHRMLRETHARLRELTIGLGDPAVLDNPNRLFQCGWSWGVRADAPPIETDEPFKQPDGVALPAPYLYFTAVALDGIQDLFTERTRVLGLLNEEQYRLARNLQVRWDLTQSYWATIASFGDRRWPLEDIPWRTIDALESDYFTLLVTAIMVQAMGGGRPASDADLGRVSRVLDDLASRGRITRRPFTDDVAVRLHSPGVVIPLEGSEQVGGPTLNWIVSDFSPQLLQRTIQAASLVRSPEQRSHLLQLADQVWEHVLQRRHRSGPASQLWDQPAGAYPELAGAANGSQPSWYYTQRVVESLIAAAGLVGSPPLPSVRANNLAADMLAEAEHMFDQEQLRASATAGASLASVLKTAQATLSRAREILPTRPSTAQVLAGDVLRELDRLAAARLGSSEMA